MILSENRPSTVGTRVFTRFNPVLQKEELMGPVGSHLLVFIRKRNQHLLLLKSWPQSTSMAFTAVATGCWGSSCDAPALPLPRHSPQLASSFPQQQRAAGMTALYLPLPCWPGTSTKVFGSTALQADRPAPVRCVNTPRHPNSPDCYSADHLVSKRQ